MLDFGGSRNLTVALNFYLLFYRHLKRNVLLYKAFDCFFRLEKVKFHRCTEPESLDFSVINIHKSSIFNHLSKLQVKQLKSSEQYSHFNKYL